MSDFSFEGGRALEAALLALGKPATARSAGTKALRVAAEPIAARARILAPKDEHDLEHSIKVGKAISAFQRDGNRGDYIATFVGIDESIDKRLHIYAKAQEDGTNDTPPNPYMMPAWDMEKGEAVKRIAPALWAEIQKAVARAGRRRR